MSRHQGANAPRSPVSAIWPLDCASSGKEHAMQAGLLGGGQGTRIRDVAEDLPKPLVPIGGRPILWHIMKGFAQQGFDDFILCLGYKSWLIKRYFLDYQAAQADFSLRLAAPEQVQILAPA